MKRTSLAAAAFLSLALAGCDLTDLVDAYTALSYLGDGDAIVLEGTDGIHVAIPADDDPTRLSGTGDGCEGDWKYSLGCVRKAPDGQRVAVLTDKAAAPDGTTIWKLRHYDISALDFHGTIVSSQAFEASYDPVGHTLVWTESDGQGGASLFCLQDGGSGPDLLLEHVPLWGTPKEEALSAIVLTGEGVLYADEGFSGIALWFHPFDGGQPRELGVLPTTCAGSGIDSCTALGHDGVTVAWQGAGSGVLEIYRSDADVRLPLGSGSSFRFSKTGSLLLRQSSRSLFIHRSDNGAIVRQIDLVSSGQLSGDGETAAWLSIASAGLGTGFLMTGDARREGNDAKGPLFHPADSVPLWASPSGSSAMPFAFTADGRYVVISAAPSADQGEGAPPSSIYSLNVETGEVLEMAAPACSRCCQVLAYGHGVVCTPPVVDAQGNTSASLLFMDPATGETVQPPERLLSWRAVPGGQTVLFTGAPRGDVSTSTLFALADGQVRPICKAYRFEISPDGRHMAIIDKYGRLKVKHLP